MEHYVRDWRAVGVEEYGYVAPDPLNPNIVYGGKATRFDMTTGQVQNVAPEVLRVVSTGFLERLPIMFSPGGSAGSLLAGNVLFKTVNGGSSGRLSVLTCRVRNRMFREHRVFRRPEMATQPRRGVIYAIAPSPKDVNTILGRHRRRACSLNPRRR
jgi:hypothetical protein